MRKLILTIVLSLASGALFASPPLKGKVTEIWINDGSNTNIVFVSVGQSFSTPCRESDVRYLVMDLTEPSMREAYSMTLAAYMAGQEITMAGNGSCHGIHEKLKYINMIK